MKKINNNNLEKLYKFKERLILEEILELANFHSITLPVEYGDGTVANEKFIDIEELELILTSVLEEL